MFDTINKTIIARLGIDTLPLEHRKEAFEKVGSLVYEEIMIGALRDMTDEDKDVVGKLVDSQAEPEAIFSLLSEKVPTLEAIVSESIEIVRPECAEIMSEIGK